MANYGFNFRATVSAGISPLTDGTGQTYVLHTETSATRNGITFGWDAATALDSRDRLTTGDVRMAGMNFTGNASTERYFGVTLPATGDWIIRAAFGDGTAGQTQYVRFKEGTTTFATITNIGSASNGFVDAAGTAHATQAAWISSNASISRTFTTTSLRVYIGDPAALGGNNTTIAHLYIEQVGGGATALDDGAGYMPQAADRVTNISLWRQRWARAASGLLLPRPGFA